MLQNIILFNLKRFFCSVFASKYLTAAVIFTSFIMLTIYLRNGAQEVKFNTNYRARYKNVQNEWKPPIYTNQNLPDSLITSSKDRSYKNSDISYDKKLRQHILMQSAKNGPWYMYNELSNRTKDSHTYFDVFPSMVQYNNVLDFEAKNIKHNFPIAFSHLIHKHFTLFVLCDLIIGFVYIHTNHCGIKMFIWNKSLQNPVVHKFR